MAKLDVGPRPAKWHIIGAESYPLCWDDQALEFDTKKDAEEFLTSAIANSEHCEEFYRDVIIQENILYYDGGYIDATHLLVGWDGIHCETILVNKD